MAQAAPRKGHIHEGPTRRAMLGGGMLALWGGVPAQAQAPRKVITTFTVIADIARNVAGTSAIVESITKPGAEIHTYEPTP